MKNDRKNYIEFRAYLKDDADVTKVLEVADKLQDVVADFALDCETDDDGHDVFNKDVTYHVAMDVDFTDYTPYHTQKKEVN